MQGLVAIGKTREGTLVFNRDTMSLEINNSIDVINIIDLDKTVAVLTYGKDEIRVFRYGFNRLDLDNEGYSKWIEEHRDLEIFTVNTSYNTLEQKNSILANRFEDLADTLQDGGLEYNIVRNAVLIGGDAGLKSMKEQYMSNQGVYKHFDGSTTSIDVDGFYKSEYGAFRSVSDALREMASDIRNGCVIPKINDRIYTVDRLLDIHSSDDLKERYIIPVKIKYSTNKLGVYTEGEEIRLMRPVYTDKDDLTIDLRRLYKVAKGLAIKCLCGKEE